MPIYTIHVPGAAPDFVSQADDTVFLRDGFSVRAFLFGLLYLLWHRLWLAAGIWALLLVLLGLGTAALQMPAFFVVALLGLMHLYLGTEGPDLLRGGLARRGQPMRDVVSAPDRDTAERLFFDRPGAVPTPEPHRPAPPWTPHPAMPAVIGMFPDEAGA